MDATSHSSSTRSRDAATRQSDGRARSAASHSGSGATPPVLTTAQSTNKTLLPQAGDVLSIEVQLRNPRRRFPLSDQFLPRLSIARDQVELLKRQCIVEMNRVLRKSSAAWAHSELMFEGGSGEWKAHYTSKQHHLTVYRRKRESNTASMRHFVARGQISSVSLKDLEYGLYCDTTTDERAVKTDLYRELFLDAAVLRAFERQREDDAFHFFGVKWLACVSPADKFVSSRDYAVVEYSRTVESGSGEKVLVKVVLPVDADRVSVLAEREYDLVRGAMACSYLYRYDAGARAVQVFAEGWLDPSGSATAWMGKTFLTHFAPTIVNLDNAADVKHFVKHGRVLSTDAFLARVKEAKLSEAHKHCTACLKAFSTGLRKRTHASCRCCGQFVCSRCVIHFTLCLPWHEKRNAEHPSAVIDEKFCLKCVCLVRAHRNQPPLHAAASTSETPSSVSSSQRSLDDTTGSSRRGGGGVTLLARQVKQLNFEDAPLPSREALEEAHGAHKPAGAVDRLRQLKERHLAKDKHRNLGERAAVPHETAAALSRMEQSIAEQEELLRNIQFERMRRDQLQREAFAQFQQQMQLRAQQQYYLQQAGTSSVGSSRSSHWKPSMTGTSSTTSSTVRMTDASITSLACTAVSAEYDTDDEVYSIAEGSAYDLPSPPRYARSAAARQQGTATFV